MNQQGVQHKLNPTGMSDEQLSTNYVMLKMKESGVSWYFGKEFSYDELYAPVLRARVSFMAPIKGFRSNTDRVAKQERDIEWYIRYGLHPYLRQQSGMIVGNASVSPVQLHTGRSPNSGSLTRRSPRTPLG